MAGNYEKKTYLLRLPKSLNVMFQENLDVIFEEQKQMKNKLNKIEKLLG